MLRNKTADEKVDTVLQQELSGLNTLIKFLDLGEFKTEMEERINNLKIALLKKRGEVENG